MPLLLLIMFVLAAGSSAALGVAIERFAYRPLRDAPRIAPLITAIGDLVLPGERGAAAVRRAVSAIYNTPDFISFSTGIQIGSVSIDAVQIMVLVLGLALMIGLRQLVNRTKLGKQMRAVAADREAAEMLGHQREPHDRDDVLPRLGAGGRGRRDGRAAVQSGRRTRSASSPA